MMDRSKISFAETQRTIIDQITNTEDKGYAQTIVYDFMITVIYSELETSIREMLLDKFRSQNDLANKYLESLNKLHFGLKLKDIAGLLKKMNLLRKGETLIKNDIIEKTYSDFIDIRNTMSHEGLRPNRTNDPHLLMIIYSTQVVLTEIEKILST